VTVPQPPPNNPPVLANDSASLPMWEAITISVLSNDYDPDGDALFVTGLSKTDSTKASYSTDGQTIQVTAKGSKGADSVVYTVTDGHGNTRTATLSITVVN